MTESTSLARVTELVTPIVTDLKLDLYDLEFRGGTLRITIDTPPDSPTGVGLDAIALATRLISRDLDHHDPIAGHYVLEVSSPGLERSLRTPAHFRREIGKDVAVRLRDIGQGGERRLHGRLTAADDAGFTVMSDDGTERTVGYEHIDRAKTVFQWGPAPKLGGPKNTSKSNKDTKNDTTAPHRRATGAGDEAQDGAGDVSAANRAESRPSMKGAGA